MKKDIENNMYINVSSYIIQPSVISKKILQAIKSNKQWNNSEKVQGISQAYENFNFAASLICHRKFSIPIDDNTNKIEKPRHCHCSQWGLTCPCATPESKKVGLIQGLSLGSYITTGCSSDIVEKLLSETDVIPISLMKNYSDFIQNCKIFINGSPYGYTEFPHDICKYLRSYRRRGCINPEISIAYNDFHDEINIYTDGGRFARGLAIADSGKLNITYEILQQIENGEWENSDINVWVRLLESGFV